MFPPRPGPGLGAVCKGRPRRRGAPKQGEPCTQPAAGAVASATEESGAAPSTRSHTVRLGQSCSGQGGGLGQGTRCADSGPGLEPGGWEGTGSEHCGEPSPTHSPPEPMPVLAIPCPAQSWCLCSPAPVGTSGAPARRPPPALESCCWLSSYRSRPLRPGAGLYRGRGYIGGGATAAGARLALEVAAAPLPEQNVARTRPTLQAVRSSQPGLRRGNKWTCSPDQLGGLEQGPWCLAPLDVRHVLGYRDYFCLEHLLSADHAHTHLF